MFFNGSSKQYQNNYWYIYIIFCLFSLKIISTNFAEESELPSTLDMSIPKLVPPIPKVGIIGGGIGGTATAYFLKKIYKEAISLHLYESEKVGGRLLTSSKFGRKYEAGGSIIHPKNEYLQNFIKELGLRKNFGCSEKVGIFNGQEYAFVESNWNFITAIKAFLRYGLDLYWLQTYNSKMLKDFAKIYDHQRQGLSFKSVESLLQSMDPNFPSLVRKSFRSYLKENQFHDIIIDELVAACTRANYGQSPNIHAFVGDKVWEAALLKALFPGAPHALAVIEGYYRPCPVRLADLCDCGKGSVSVAGATPNLWSVIGGNEKVPEGLLNHSGAQLLSEHVIQIAQRPMGKFKVGSRTESEENVREFDAVAIAAPLTQDKSQIKFVNFSSSFDFPGRYERIVCTLVEGKVNETTFKYKEMNVRVEEILTDNPALKYNTLGKQFPVDSDNRCGDNKSLPVYKVFSPKPLSEEDLSALFESYNRLEVFDWLAYPHYDSVESLGHFELVPGLYYNNAIEKAASAMEMSAIAAHNTALLIHDFLKNAQPFPRTEPKEEL